MNQRSDVQALTQRVESLRERGSGYVEVSHLQRAFPWLAFSFIGDHGVVHQFTSGEECQLLRGDGSVGKEVVVEVPVFDEDSPFTGDYVSTADRAWKVVQDFVEGVEPRALGEWDRL